MIADIQARKIQEIYTTDQAIRLNSLTKDNRYIYGVMADLESEIWMLSLGENPAAQEQEVRR
jgi:hypothetical protein